MVKHVYVLCPNESCKQKLRLSPKDEYFGKKKNVKCPKCETIFGVFIPEKIIDGSLGNEIPKATPKSSKPTDLEEMEKILDTLYSGRNPYRTAQ